MFTPVETTVGAVLIHLATTSYLFATGKTIGFSSVLGNSNNVFNSIHTVSILAGLAISGLIVAYWLPDFIPRYDGSVTLTHYVVSGALVGFGTQFGCGCTSGHMITGLSRLRWRSLVATAVFSSVAMLTTNLLDLGDECPAGYCYFYDTTLANWLQNRNALDTIAVVAVVSSYAVVPLLAHYSSPTITRIVSGLNSGILFGLGLLISGMASPSKTLGFLSVYNYHKFDPSLALIIVFAIIPNIILWNLLILKRKTPLVPGSRFDLNFANETPKSFLIGNAIFGLGWGSLGICPGPGILGIGFNGVNGLAWAASFMLFYKLAKAL